MSDKCSLKRTNPTSTPDMKLLENQIPFKEPFPQAFLDSSKNERFYITLSWCFLCFFFGLKKKKKTVPGVQQIHHGQVVTPHFIKRPHINPKEILAFCQTKNLRPTLPLAQELLTIGKEIFGTNDFGPGIRFCEIYPPKTAFQAFEQTKVTYVSKMADPELLGFAKKGFQVHS